MNKKQMNNSKKGRLNNATKIFALFLLAGMTFSGCKKDGQSAVDSVYPQIDITAQSAFPVQCSMIKRGEQFTFIANLTDNQELGSVSVDIHHNFDHHSHSTEVNECGFEPVKTPVKPFLLIGSEPIPKGLKSYQTGLKISVPADVDPGDYHFMIRLTDKEGWQTIKGLSIKII